MTEQVSTISENRSLALLAETYNLAVKGGQLKPDAAQMEAVALLSQLQQGWAAEPKGRRLIGQLFGRRATDRRLKQGAYLWGGVGRGKSLLMDMFFDTTQIEPKRRVHYHAFMIDVHARIHQWREENRDDLKNKDPIPPLAEALAAEAKLLCLDEFQVQDVADAMILGRLFTALFNLGVRVVFTSNRRPDDLYLHGLQRDRFLTFIALIHERLEVVELRSAEDYRLRHLKNLRETFMVGASGKTRAGMDEAFRHLSCNAPAKSRTLDVQGHALFVPAYHGDVARFSFADLCAKPLGAADYITLAQEFSTILLDDIPQLSPEKRNEAKRFVALIDTLYDHKVKFIASAAVAPDKLYPAGDGSFEFARTASRLVEMQSEAYLSVSHHV